MRLRRKELDSGAQERREREIEGKGGSSFRRVKGSRLFFSTPTSPLQKTLLLPLPFLPPPPPPLEARHRGRERERERGDSRYHHLFKPIIHNSLLSTPLLLSRSLLASSTLRDAPSTNETYPPARFPKKSLSPLPCSLASVTAEVDESEFAGEHSLSQQRYYTLTCLVYGSDTEKYANLLEDEWLTPERAEQCPAEFERLSTSWYALLDPHLKE